MVMQTEFTYRGLVVRLAVEREEDNMKREYEVCLPDGRVLHDPDANPYRPNAEQFKRFIDREVFGGR